MTMRRNLEQKTDLTSFLCVLLQTSNSLVAKDSSCRSTAGPIMLFWYFRILILALLVGICILQYKSSGKEQGTQILSTLRLKNRFFSLGLKSTKDVSSKPKSSPYLARSYSFTGGASFSLFRASISSSTSLGLIVIPFFVGL